MQALPFLPSAGRLVAARVRLVRPQASAHRNCFPGVTGMWRSWSPSWKFHLVLGKHSCATGSLKAGSSCGQQPLRATGSEVDDDSSGPRGKERSRTGLRTLVSGQARSRSRTHTLLGGGPAFTQRDLRPRVCQRARVSLSACARSLRPTVLRRNSVKDCKMRLGLETTGFP
jgi:hypothetical protein